MPTAFPTPEDVARVAAMTDMAERNREVTLGYYALSQRFKNRIPEDANWTTFATWASAQAGRTIRKEDLLRTLERRLGDSPAVRRIVEGPLRISAKFLLGAVLQLNPFERSSQAVARGNIKVYEEIGAEIAKFLSLVESGASDAGFTALYDSLKPGPPPEGQEYLTWAFPAFRKAMELPPGSERSQWVLYGNLCIGCHEQTRLQPEIEESLNGTFWDTVEVKEHLADVLVPHLAPARRALGAIAARAMILPQLGPLVAEIRRIVQEIITEAMMVLELPGETLRLGRDLGGTICERLQIVENVKALELLKSIDLTPDSLTGTGTGNWTVFPQRMHFIADLFRSRQDYLRLFEPIP